MSNTIFYLLFICSTIYCSGQGTFNKLYDFEGEHEWGESVIQCLDGSFLVVNSAKSASPLWALFALKIDENGDTIWTNGYFLSTPSGGILAGSVIELADSSFIICGHAYDSSEGASDTYLMKIAANGDSLWHRSIEGGFNDRAYDLIQTADNGFAIAGYIYDSSFNSTEISLIKTDSVGNVSWQKLFSSSSTYDFANSIDQTTDGGFIIGGETRISVGNYDLFLLKTDSIGNQNWWKKYGNSQNETYGYAHSTFDSGYILTGMRKINPSDHDAYVLKLDVNGAIQWEKTFSRGDRLDQFQSVRQLNDGNFIIAGNTQYYLDSIKSNNSGWLVKLSASGDLIWDRVYTYYNPKWDSGYYHYFSELEPTSDQGYIMCGYITYPTPSQKNNIWVVKVDSLGCDTPNCVEVGILELESNHDQIIRIAPNPFNNSTSISIYIADFQSNTPPILELFDIFGRKIQSMSVPTTSIQYATITFNRDNLSPGLYLVQLILDNRIIATEKLIIE